MRPLSILAACLLAAPALAEDLTGTASRIVDGDTLYLSDHYACPDYAVRRHGCYVRLWGADTPERGEPGYRAARRLMSAHVGVRVVCYRRQRRLTHGRIVAQCWTGDGHDIAMLARCADLARDWPRYSGGYYARCR